MMRTDDDSVFTEQAETATEASAHTDGEHNDAQLHPGDTGMLPEAARRALVQLLSGPSLEQRRHPRLWPALLQHEAVR